MEAENTNPNPASVFRDFDSESAQGAAGCFTEEILYDSVTLIDDLFGAGYARQHPDLLGKIVAEYGAAYRAEKLTADLEMIARAFIVAAGSVHV